MLASWPYTQCRPETFIRRYQNDHFNALALTAPYVGMKSLPARFGKLHTLHAFGFRTRKGNFRFRLRRSKSAIFSPRAVETQLVVLLPQIPLHLFMYVVEHLWFFSGV